MKKNISIKLYVLSFIGLILYGCGDESLMKGGNTLNLGEEIEVTFGYNLSGVSVLKARGVVVTEDVMNRITPGDINVLVYGIDEDGDEAFVYHRGVFDHLHTGNSGTFKVRLAKSREGEKYSIDFIFNRGATFSNFLGAINIGDKREAVRTILSEDNNFLPEATQTRLPMWAGLEPQVISESTYFSDLSVIRSVGRIDIGLNLDNNDQAGGLENFKLSSAGYIYTASRNFYIPGRENINGDNVTAPSYPSTYVYGTNTTLTSLSNVTENRVIGGLFPCDTRGDYASSSHYFSLIIGGTYTDASGSTSTEYYRIVLVDPANPAERLDIVRNHKYRVNILSVNGTGYSTPELARDGAPNNSIIYELSVHEEGDINHVVYSGSAYLGVSEVYSEYAGGAGTGSIKIKTDVPGGWQMQSVVDDTGTTPAWITFGSSSGAADAVETISFTLQENLSDPRSVLVTFTAGALSIQVRILQNGAWYIYSDYQPGTLMNGEGDAYDVYVYGNVPLNLKVRAYGPLRSVPVSYQTLTYDGGIKDINSPETRELDIIGNAWLPMKIRDVEFQYSIDNGATWVTFEEGPQGKGHYRLKSTGRIVALYNMEDANGNPLDISWAEAMGVDADTDVSAEVGMMENGYNPGHGNGFNAHSLGYNYDTNFPWSTSKDRRTVYHNYDDVATRKTGTYLPSPAVPGNPGTGYPINGELLRNLYNSITVKDGKTGCAVYNEDKYGFADKYPQGRWRLPSIRELEEMAEYEEHIGDLPLTGPDDNYWSSTEYARMGLRMQAIYFHFNDGPVIIDPMNASQNGNYKSGIGSSKKLRIRCVFVPNNWVAPNSEELAYEYFH